MTDAAVEERTCSTCGESCPGDANWCEACGSDLDAVAAAPKQPCVSCAAPAVEVTDDGWCQVCGTKQPAPDDHVVADHGWFAVVSDRGRVHRTNEDAGAVAPRAAGVAMVVCDGVSSTAHSQHASQNAVRAIIDLIATARPAAIEQAILDAAKAAQVEIVGVTTRGAAEPPSCTMVSVVADIDGANATINLGWLGDSRAYWLANGSATELTRDHSWAIEQTDLGELDQATIDADPRAHSITRWLGADSQDVTPEQISMRVELPGLLLVCSDGLWNYAPTETELYDVVHRGAADETALARAERLVAFANEQGGHDNITVAIAALRPTTDPSSNEPLPNAEAAATINAADSASPSHQE